jgi:hypothetical protein
MLTAARLTFRLYRFELIAVLAYGLGLGILAIIVTVRLGQINPGLECLRYWFTQAGELGPGCVGVSEFLGRSEEEAGKVMAAMWLLPLVAGVLTGAVLVAREIEHRTAQFAWSVGPKRLRWFADRVLPVLAVLLVAVIVPAVAAEWLVAARSPWLDAVASGADFGLRGPIPVALAFAVFGLAVLVGSLLGRMLPALIIATILAFALRAVVSGFVPFGEPIVALNPATVYTGLDASFVLDSGWQTKDGRIVRQDEALALAPAGSSQDAAYTWVASNLVSIPMGVEGPDVWRVEARESVILVVIGSASLLAAALVVRRRRPY